MSLYWYIVRDEKTGELRGQITDGKGRQVWQGEPQDDHDHAYRETAVELRSRMGKENG